MLYENNQSEKCRELLYALYMEYRGNAEHVNYLHEMFVSFVADHRRDETTHQGVVHTYSQLRELLMEADKLFGTQP